MEVLNINSVYESFILCRGRRIRLAGGIPLCNKILVAVDFDHTLIDANSDTYIVKLAPEQKFPEDICKRYSPGEA